MARSRPSDFLDRMVGAAAIVFAEKGLRRARMSDVARQMQVAHGTLYNYVESKEALFHLLLAHGASREPLPLPAKLPVRAPSARALRAQLKKQLAGSFEPSQQLARALSKTRCDDVRDELQAILGELYDRIEQNGAAITAIEQSSFDLPPSAVADHRRSRELLQQQLTRYIERRVGTKHFYATGDPDIAARLVVEAISLFARGRDGADDRTLARETVIEMLIRSLIPVEHRDMEG